MKYVILGFSHDKGDWISTLFSWATFGGPSHVVLISPDSKWYIESTALRTPPGVQPPAPIEELLKKPGLEIRVIAHKNPDLVWEKMLSIVGQPYDWGWLFGWVFRNRKWDSPGKWICAEAITWAMLEAGKCSFSFDDTWHISPGDLRLMSEKLY